METNKVYEVPEGNWTELCKRLEKLTRRAVKIGKPVPILNQIGEVTKPVEGKKGLVRTYYQCTIEAEPVCINGFDFVGKIELGDSEIGLIIDKVPNMLPELDIPQEFRKTTNYCSHCQKSVRRNNVYILRNQITGEWSQVGKNCLSLYLGGVDPENIVKYMETLINFDSLVSGAQSSDFFGIGGGQDSLDLQTVLTFTNFVIQKNGWLSRTKVKELSDEGIYNKVATANIVEEAYFIIPPYQSDVVKSLIHDYDQLSENDKDQLSRKAESAIEWARNLKEEDLNDYLQNLKILCSKDSFNRKYLGYVCSVIITYENTTGRLERLKEQAESNKKLVHIGTVGARGSFQLMVKDIKYWPSSFGVITAIFFEDKDRNRILWKASSDPNLNVGSWYDVAAMVKEYSDYKGISQTLVTRAKINGEIGKVVS